jgi:hypothetical protein
MVLFFLFLHFSSVHCECDPSIENECPKFCRIEYLGDRNYYNPETQMCEPIIKCSENEVSLLG